MLYTGMIYFTWALFAALSIDKLRHTLIAGEWWTLVGNIVASYLSVLSIREK